MKESLNVLVFCTLSLLEFSTLSSAATLQLPRTGETSCHDRSGSSFSCGGAGQDGSWQAGQLWTTPRFIDNSNGTVTDNLTGLIWLTNATCTDTVGGVNKTSGTLPWDDATTWSGNLADGFCGLTDGSVAGDWRLPNRLELISLEDASMHAPVLPAGHPFVSVPTGYTWSSSSSADDPASAWRIDMNRGAMEAAGKTESYSVWPVRGGLFGNGGLSVSPLTRDFGIVPLGARSDEPLTVSNSAPGGSTALQINGIALTGADAGEFVLDSGNGSGGTCGRTPILPPGGSCGVTVSYVPTSVGSKYVVLRISGSDRVAPSLDVPLTGAGGFDTATVSGDHGTVPSSSLTPAVSKTLSPLSSPGSGPVAMVGMYIFDSVTAAYGAIDNGGEMRLKEGDTSEVVTFDRPVSFIVKGGYYYTYTSVVGVTTIHGDLTISDGTVSVENVALGE